jgi:uncharacterized membrane protein YdjX (TVP38/TMEM64 family)
LPVPDTPGIVELMVGAAERVQAMGAAAALVYLGIYIAATVALLPGSILAMIAGALFGFGYGLGVAFAGAVLGSSAAFVVARHGVRGAAARWLDRRVATGARAYGHVASVDRSIGRRGLALVFLLRLSPFIPYNVLNYALGLTRVRFRDYVAGSVGMLPATIFYVYAGHLAGDVAAAAAGQTTTDGARLLILGPGLLATLLAAWLLSRYAQRALERIPASEPASPTSSGESRRRTFPGDHR